MRFKLRTLLVIFVLISAACCWFGSRYIKWKKEQRLLADLETGVSFAEFVPMPHRQRDDLYERYPPDRLLEYAKHYSSIAVNEPSQSVSARIAAAALAQYGSRYDRERKEFVQKEDAVRLAEQYVESGIEPLASAATWVLMRHYRFSDDLASSQAQFCRAEFEDGFDADNPIDVYVLVTEVYSDFYYSDGEDLIAQNWPKPDHPWGWNLPDTASHTYQDKVDALRQVLPEAAEFYASILEVFRKCNGNPSAAQRKELHQMERGVIDALDKYAIFRFMIKHSEDFKSQSEWFSDEN